MLTRDIASHHVNRVYTLQNDFIYLQTPLNLYYLRDQTLQARLYDGRVVPLSVLTRPPLAAPCGTLLTMHVPGHFVHPINLGNASRKQASIACRTACRIAG